MKENLRRRRAKVLGQNPEVKESIKSILMTTIHQRKLYEEKSIDTAEKRIKKKSVSKETKKNKIKVNKNKWIH